MLDQEDFSTFSKIGQALWSHPDVSRRSCMDTLAAVSLVKTISPSEFFERACTSLLERGRRTGAVTKALGEPFFRLSADERLALVAMHCGKWSYARLCRVLDIDREALEELLWRARMQLVEQFNYPSGHSYQSAECPEYDQNRPWMQQFLDHEFPSARDEVVLQNHLVHCFKCRAVLTRWRGVYFKIDEGLKQTWLPKDLSDPREEENARVLRTMLQRKPFKKSAIEMNIKESLEIFLQNSDIQLILMALAFFIVSRVLLI